MTTKKSEILKNFFVTACALFFSASLVSCNVVMGKSQYGNLTISLPAIKSNERAISSDRIEEVKIATVSYRVIVDLQDGQRLEKTGDNTNFVFSVPYGTTVEIIVECLNSSGDVIVRAKKIHMITSDLNKILINLASEGEESFASDTESSNQETPVPSVIYTIQFDGNGASGTQDDITFSSNDSGTGKDFPAVTFTNPGRTFSHWATSSDGLEVKFEYIVTMVNLGITSGFDMSGNTITVYAVWN